MKTKTRSIAMMALLLLVPPSAAFAQTGAEVVAAVGVIAETANQILKVIDTGKKALDFLGILDNSGPDIQAEFDKLNSHLDQVEGEVTRVYRVGSASERYGTISAQVRALMIGMSENDIYRETSRAIAQSESLEVMETLRSAFSSPDRAGSLRRRGDQEVYDWRLSVPELMQAIALRVAIISAIEPDWITDPGYVNEVGEYRDWLISHRTAMLAGIRCDWIVAPTCGSECSGGLQECRDAASGLSGVSVRGR